MKTTQPLIAPDTIKRILLIRLRFIGDVVLTTPLIRAVRRQFPETELVYLAENGPASILQDQPELDTVLTLDRDCLAKVGAVAHVIGYMRFFRMLRRKQFDLVIDLFGNPRSALLTVATGARYRVGFDVRGRGMAYNVKIHRTGSNRVTDAYLDAWRTLGFPVDDDRTCLVVGEASRDWAMDWMETQSLSGHWPIVGLNPGASWPAKRWRPERFAELADTLITRTDAKIVLIQGPNQETFVEATRSAMTGTAVVAPLISLPQLAALIQSCTVFVSNDSGPMHIAAAVGTPTIGLFGPSRPEIWFPYPPEQGHAGLRPEVPDCCGRDVCLRNSPCIDQLSVSQVCEAVERALEVGAPLR